MNKLQEMYYNIGFKITWKLICIGLFGKSYISPQVSRNDVFVFLDHLLTIGHTQSENIIQVICEQDNPDRIDSLIQLLSNQEHSDEQTQLRKWRAFLLSKTLSTLPSDSFQGLLILTEFWIDAGPVKDCPHIFPSKNTKKYFTQSTYDDLKNKNKAWLKNEIANINLFETNLPSTPY